MDDSYALPLGMLITYIIASLLFGCGSNLTETSASGQIISVQKQDVIGDDIETTIVFDNGQVESIRKVIGKEGDIVFFDPVTIRKSDSAIVGIPHNTIIKNISKGREFYGQ